MPSNQDSEYRAYSYIESVLKNLGWDTRNPRKGGSVYTQAEFRNHDLTLTQGLGGKAPEYVVVIPSDAYFKYWVIEAKRSHGDISVALREAQKYGDMINVAKPGTARFATGIAGTPDESFLVKTSFWSGEDWHPVAINNYEATGFLTLEQCTDIIVKNSPNLNRFDYDPKMFLNQANAINSTLHTNEIPVAERASVMASLLLALAQDSNIRLHQQPQLLVHEINGLIKAILHKHGKSNFAGPLQLQLPATEKNHRKYRQAILDTLQILREMNIRSAVNSGDDALGTFYETFLKYANGAKEMGIVLTPRHITKFAVDVLRIGPYDRVFDPACGTGGFLVAAMDAVRQQLSADEHELSRQFMRDGLYGVEQRDDVYGLAMVNMIFRGDGKSHIEDGNCFDHQFYLRDNKVSFTLNDDSVPDGARPPFTRVLMNPPFKLRANPETKCVDHGLTQLVQGGLLFAVLPVRCVRSRRFAGWRSEMMSRHTIRACIQFDNNLFYPVAAGTYGLIVQGHIPHHSDQPVFMGCLFDDMHRPRRSKVLSDYDAKDNVERMTDELRRFLLGQPVTQNIDREQRVVRIDADSEPGLRAESYLNTGSVTIRASGRYVQANAATMQVMTKNVRTVLDDGKTDSFSLSRFVATQHQGQVTALKHCSDGNIPVVTNTAKDNGISKWLDIPLDKCHSHCITISTVHNTKPCQAFWHPYTFAAVNTILVLELQEEWMENEYAIYYLCEAITACNAWRYDYERTVDYDELLVELPVTNNGGGGRGNPT